MEQTMTIIFHSDGSLNSGVHST